MRERDGHVQRVSKASLPVRTGRKCDPLKREPSFSLKTKALVMAKAQQLQAGRKGLTQLSFRPLFAHGFGRGGGGQRTFVTLSMRATPASFAFSPTALAPKRLMYLSAAFCWALNLSNSDMLDFISTPPTWPVRGSRRTTSESTSTYWRLEGHLCADQLVAVSLRLTYETLDRIVSTPWSLRELAGGNISGAPRGHNGLGFGARRVRATIILALVHGRCRCSERRAGP